MLRRMLPLGILVVMTSVAAPALAHPDHAHEEEAKPAAPLSAEAQASMDAWAKAISPGEHHAALEHAVGLFEVKVSHWMNPGQPPQVTDGVSRNSWVLGRRFVEAKYEGMFMGAPLVGIGYTGYDNAAGKYIGWWADNMGTAFMNLVGVATPPDAFTFTVTSSDPMSGKSITFRQVLTIKGPDQHVIEVFSPGPDGKELRMMEAVYTRRK